MDKQQSKKLHYEGTSAPSKTTEEVMLSKEVAQRIIPRPISKPLGRLADKDKAAYADDNRLVRGTLTKKKDFVKGSYLKFFKRKWGVDPDYEWVIPYDTVVEVPKYIADHINSLFTHKLNYKRSLPNESFDDLRSITQVERMEMKKNPLNIEFFISGYV